MTGDGHLDGGGGRGDRERLQCCLGGQSNGSCWFISFRVEHEEAAKSKSGFWTCIIGYLVEPLTEKGILEEEQGYIDVLEKSF